MTSNPSQQIRHLVLRQLCELDEAIDTAVAKRLGADAILPLKAAKRFLAMWLEKNPAPPGGLTHLVYTYLEAAPPALTGLDRHAHRFGV